MPKYKKLKSHTQVQQKKQIGKTNMFIIKKISLEYKLYMQTSITLEQCKQETPVKMLRKSTAKTSKN
jgi:hypothetical protein